MQSPLLLHPSTTTNAGTFSPAEGLSTVEATTRLEQDGPNELAPPAKEQFVRILARQAQSVFFVLTIAAAFLSYSCGDRPRAVLLVSVVCTVLLVNTLGEHTAQDAGEALRSMTAPQTTCMRDGQWSKVPATTLVAGDVVFLDVGEVV